MNMNTIIQELTKKIRNMSESDFYSFLLRLEKAWKKYHHKEDK